MYPCRKKGRGTRRARERETEEAEEKEGASFIYFRLTKPSAFFLSSSPHTYVSLFVTRSEDARKKTMTRENRLRQKHNGRWRAAFSPCGLLFEIVTKVKQMRRDANKTLLIISIRVLHTCDVECVFIMCAGVWAYVPSGHIFSVAC